MSQFSIDKAGLAARMKGAKAADLANEATSRFAQIALSGAVIEADDKPTLWERAVVPALLGGLATLAAISAVDPAMARAMSRPPSSQTTQAYAGVYHADANRVLKEQSFWNRQVSGISIAKVRSDKAVDVQGPEIRSIALPWNDNTCKGYVAKVDTAGKEHGKHLNLPRDVSLEDIRTADAVSYCLVLNHLSKEQADQYKNRIGGLWNVAELQTVAAFARYGEQAYNSVLNVKIADAAAQAKSPDPTTKLVGETRLEAFGRLHMNVNWRKDGLAHLATMDFGKTVNLAMYTRDEAEADVLISQQQGSRVEFASLGGSASAGMLASRNKEGTSGARTALGKIAGLGLVRDVPVPTVSPDDCPSAEKCQVHADLIVQAAGSNAVEAYRELISDAPANIQTAVYRSGMK